MSVAVDSVCSEMIILMVYILCVFDLLSVTFMLCVVLFQFLVFCEVIQRDRSCWLPPGEGRERYLCPSPSPSRTWGVGGGGRILV